MLLTRCSAVKQNLFTAIATGNLHLKVCVSYLSVMALVFTVGLERVGVCLYFAMEMFL